MRIYLPEKQSIDSSFLSLLLVSELIDGLNEIYCDLHTEY